MDRRVVDSTTTQEVQLGNYDDANQFKASSANSTTIQSSMTSVNMETFDLSNTMLREYPIGQVTWSTVSGPGTVIATFDFPSVLFSQRYIQEKIKDFRMFRGGVRLTCRMSASSWLYGKVMVFADPCYTGVVADNRHAYTTTVSPYIASGFPHILMSASASDAAVFDLPYVSPDRALDLDNYTEAELWRVRIIVLNDLRHVDGIAASAQILVTAQFTDVDMYLPNDFSTESKRKEIHKKTAQHSVASNLESKEVLDAAITSSGFGQTVSDIFTIGKSLATIAAVAGLSKPSTMDMTQVTKINPYNDMSTSKGVDTSLVAGLTQDNEISTKPNVGGVDLDEMEFKYVCGTPTLINSFNMIPTSPITEVASASLNNALGVFNYAEFVGRMFRYWSGSIKIKVYITASNMHSVRGVFYFNEYATQNNNAWQNCYHRVVDIQGDMEVDFVLPWSENSIAASTTAAPTMALYFRVLTWSQGAAATTSSPISLNVYKALASDVQFGGLTDFIVEPQSNPRKDFTMDFEPIHPSISSYEHKGLIWGEMYTSLREVIHRYYPYAVASTTAPLPWYRSTGSLGTNIFYGLEAIGLLYRFFRGSVRWKLLQKDNVNRVALSTYSSTSSGAFQGFSMSSTVNPLCELATPFYVSTLFVSTSTPQTGGRGVFADRRGGQYEFKAAGDDFSFHFLSPPPSNYLVKTTHNYGLQAFRTWLAT